MNETSNGKMQCLLPVSFHWFTSMLVAVFVVACVCQGQLQVQVQKQDDIVLFKCGTMWQTHHRDIEAHTFVFCVSCCSPPPAGHW